MKDQEECILQTDNYFDITQTQNEVQQLVYIGSRTEGDALECWNSNKYGFNACEEVKNAIREYYSDHYNAGRAVNRINNLKQTGTV